MILGDKENILEIWSVYQEQITVIGIETITTCIISLREQVYFQLEMSLIIKFRSKNNLGIDLLVIYKILKAHNHKMMQSIGSI